MRTLRSSSRQLNLDRNTTPLTRALQNYLQRNQVSSRINIMAIKLRQVLEVWMKVKITQITRRVMALSKDIKADSEGPAMTRITPRS